MGKAKKIEDVPLDVAPGEYGPITWEEFQTLPEDARKRRGARALKKLQALRGKVHLRINLDELRGRTRR